MPNLARNFQPVIENLQGEIFPSFQNNIVVLMNPSTTSTPENFKVFIAKNKKKKFIIFIHLKIFSNIWAFIIISLLLDNIK